MFGNMKVKTVKLLAWMCIGIFLVAMTICIGIKLPKPMLKITVDKGTIGFLPAGTNYYIVYDNGAVKKTKNFIPAKVEDYNFFPKQSIEDSVVLHGIDINTPEGEYLNEIAKNILFLTDEPKLNIVSVAWLFVLGERYFFEALYDENMRISKLFEYNVDDNSIQEVASVKRGSINHVELYEPQ